MAVPHPARIAFVVMGTVANAVLALIYLWVGIPLIDMAVVDHAGPWSAPVEWLYVIIPAVIGVLQLGLLIWLIVAPAQEQRAATQVVR